MNMTRGAAESWEIVISEDELMKMMAITTAISRRETGSSVVWLTRVPNGPRLWIFREGSVVTWLTASAARTDPVIAIPIPEMFFGSLGIASGEDESITLSCNMVDGTITARTATRSIAVDLPTDVEFQPMDLPYQRQDDSLHLHPTMATVAMRDLAYLAMVAHDVPRGLRLGEELRMEERFYPYVSIAIGNGKMSWTSDWRRHGMGRTTATVPAVTAGSVTAMFFPYQVARVIFTKDVEDDVRMFIDGPEADFIYIVGDDWGIRVRKEFEEVVRWRRSLIEALESSDHKPTPDFVGTPRNKVTFMVDDALCSARILVADDGASEFIRLTATVAEYVEPTLELLTRINDLNLELVGTRVAVREHQVHVECEFPAAELPDIGSRLTAFTNAVAEVGPLFDFLPLFAADPVKD